MIGRMVLAGIFLLTFSLNGLVQAASDEVWQFGQLRLWAADPHGPNDLWSGDTATGLVGHPEIAQTDPLYKKLSNQFSRPSGLAFEEKSPEVPRGKLVWWDVDQDGKQDIVFAGGASPDPYFVVLEGTGDQWHVWQDGKGRLLTIFAKGGKVVLISAFDGYGVSRDKYIDIKVCDPGKPGIGKEVIYRWAGELGVPATSGTVALCTTVRETGLRTGPKVDLTPDESGMGFDWPGNLYQELAKDSSGWQLDKIKNKQGEPWSLVAFSDPATAADGGDPVKAIMTPKEVQRARGNSAKQEFLIGWVKTGDLNGF
jgi:hypothetical protein